MSNPRNTLAKTEEVADSGIKSPSEWKSLGLGSISLKNSEGKLIRDFSTNVVINDRNAQVILDAAQFVLDNPTESITIKASPFFEGTQSEKVLKHFSHRLYVMTETLERMGKSPADYVKSK